MNKISTPLLSTSDLVSWLPDPSEGSMVVDDTHPDETCGSVMLSGMRQTRDEFQALRNEIVALRADINYLHQEICLLKLNSVHESADDEDKGKELGEHIVDVSMLLTDKPYRRHDR